MKILGISGGNKNGANDCMCKEALLAAKEQGAEIEFVRLMDFPYYYGPFWTAYGLIQQHCCGQDLSSKRRQTDRSKIYENKSCFLHGNRWF